MKAPLLFGAIFLALLALRQYLPAIEYRPKGALICHQLVIQKA